MQVSFWSQVTVVLQDKVNCFILKLFLRFNV